MDYIKDLRTLITGLAHRHDTFQVFSDFIAMAAISFSNAVDLAEAPSREQDYLRIVKRYAHDELQRFPQMLGVLTCALEDDMADILGRLFHDLEIHNSWKGQFFTPDPLCRMLAKMNIADSARDIIAQRGYLRACEPCAGSGAMIVALEHLQHRIRRLVIGKCGLRFNLQLPPPPPPPRSSVGGGHPTTGSIAQPT